MTKTQNWQSEPYKPVSYKTTHARAGYMYRGTEEPSRPEPRPVEPPKEAPAPEPAPKKLRFFSASSTKYGSDLEFLPAALEILETPPAPRRVAFMLTICAFTAIAVIWSYFGRLDIHAIAWGKIEANGRSKVIQPLDAGKISAIFVENGSEVRAGDMLLQLDPTEAQADEIAASESLNASRAESARRRAAIKSVQILRSRQAEPAIGRRVEASIIGQDIAFDADIAKPHRAREQAVLDADLAQLTDLLKNLGRQMAQKDAARTRLEMSIAYQKTLIKTLLDRVGMREESLKLNVGTKINLFDAKEALDKSQSALAADQGQLIENEAALDELESQKDKAISQFLADNETKLAEADRKTDEIAQSLAKARVKLARTRMVSPIDGTVQQLAVTTIGQVVTTGQQLMQISPAGGALRVEAFVSNMDIGFIKLGQEAEIKIDAFPFTRFGVIHGTVVKVATDAIEEQEAKRLQANALAPANGGSGNASAPGQLQSFVFPVTLSLDASTIAVDGKQIPLTSGMTVSAEIKTDSRQVIDYLLSPLSKIKSEAMKER